MRHRFPISAALTLPLLALASARGAGLRDAYFAQARAEAARQPDFDPARMDSLSLAKLPEPVRRYFARCGFYRDMGGFRLPTRLTATWHEKEGDFEYFRGRLAKAEYEVEEA